MTIKIESDIKEIVIGIDIGGTFTDFVVFDKQSKTIDTFKILSTPNDPSIAVLEGLKNFKDKVINQIIHGSTVATNALLERKGTVTALITTKGFEDIIAIARQYRPEIYNLSSTPPDPLVPKSLRFGIEERINYLGEVVQVLDEEGLSKVIVSLRKKNVESVAISLLFSFLKTEHEKKILSELEKYGLFVSSSHQILPEYREYERTSTTLVNAYVSPVIGRYLDNLSSKSGIKDLKMMQSNGGRISCKTAQKEAVRTILSGPAGGVVGAFNVAKAAGFDKIITFDMGGTSTDVSLCDGCIKTTSEGSIGGFPIRIPIIDIHTVGSGGGSIAYVDPGGAMRVGPQSAGADPGPICYNRGGIYPTVTDANLILGRISSRFFLDGSFALEYEKTRKSLNDLAIKTGLKSLSLDLELEQLVALGIVQIANSHMERAIRVISVEKGHDPADFVLVSFGGAAGLHCCELARGLDIHKVMIPYGASTLSALGMITADVVKDYVKTVMLPRETTRDELEGLFKPLKDIGLHDLLEEKVDIENVHLECELDMRYKGQSYELPIPFKPDFISEFHKRHKILYGSCNPEMKVEIVNLRLTAIGKNNLKLFQKADRREVSRKPEPKFKGPVVLENNIQLTPFYFYRDLNPGDEIRGPAIIIHKDTTIYLGSKDKGHSDDYMNFIIEILR
jgi:N-methylhydantoinase A